MVTHGIGDTRKREGSSKLHDILLQVGNELGCLSGTRFESLGKVLEELGTGFLLSGQGDLDDSV